MGTHLPSKKGHSSPPHSLAHVYCGQMVGWIRMPLGMEVGLGPSHIVLDGDPFPANGKEHSSPPPFFSRYLLWPNGRASQPLLGCCRISSPKINKISQCLLKISAVFKPQSTVLLGSIITSASEAASLWHYRNLVL